MDGDVNVKKTDFMHYLALVAILFSTIAVNHVSGNFGRESKRSRNISVNVYLHPLFMFISDIN